MLSKIAMADNLKRHLPCADAMRYNIARSAGMDVDRWKGMREMKGRDFVKPAAGVADAASGDCGAAFSSALDADLSNALGALK